MQDKSNGKNGSLCTISVIGYSGSSAEHVHVGKSCLIHRFLSRTPYCEDHLSVISRSEFDGEIVGGSHWLYWGECDLYIAKAICSHVRVIEQCEFLDDLLFSPISTSTPYIDRCLDREIMVTNRKLAYVCKNQLGDESSFPRSYINVGSVRVSVFMCVYDITLDGSSAFHQAAFLQKVLKDLSRTDTPLVLVTTKHDCEWSTIAKHLLQLALNDVKKRWLKRRFCLIETSSRLNINIEKAFCNAVCLASGGSPLKPKLHKPHNSFLDQRMRNLSIRLRRPLQNTLQYHEYKSETDQLISIPSSIRTILNEAALSFQSAYIAQFHSENGKHIVSGPPFSASYSQAVAPHGLSSGSVVCDPNGYLFTTAQLPGISTRLSSHRDLPPPPPPPRLRLHTPHLDDVPSVHPTPPPLLLPGPRNSGLFDPTRASSFFGTHLVDKTASARTAMLADSAATYPLTRIYLYGPEDLVNSVIWALRSACPLDRFRAKDGSLHRVWILPGSGNKTEKCSPSSVVSDSDHSADPSTSTTDMTALVPPDRKIIGTPHLSAFSVPAVGPTEDGPDSSYSGAGTSKSIHSSDPASRSTQSTDLGEINTSCEPPCTPSVLQFSLHILVYDTVAQLNEFGQSYDADGDTTPSHPSVDENAQQGTLPTMFNALLCWSCPRDEVFKELIVSGAMLASRLAIRLLSSDNACGPNLLSHLLSLTDQIDLNRSDSGILESTMRRPIHSFDWTSFSPSTCWPTIQYLLDSHLPNPVEQNSPNRSVPLAALVEVVNRIPQPVETVNSPGTISPVRRLLFLPPTVTALTAVKPESSPPDGPWNCSAARFLPLDQVSTVIRCQPFGSPHALIVHYMAASWLEVEMSIRENLEAVLVHSVPDSPSSSTGIGQPCISSVMLVGIHNPTLKDQCQASSMGLQGGMHCLQDMANAYNCSFRVLNPVQSIAGEDSDPLSDLTDGVMPYSVSSLETPWSHFHLLFLSLSVTSHAERLLHEKALSGDSSILYQFSGELKNEHIVTASASCNVVQRSCTPPVLNSPYPIHRITNNSTASGFPGQLPPSSPVDLSGSSLQERHPMAGSNLVELPWLPLSPARAWCSSPPMFLRLASPKPAMNPRGDTERITSADPFNASWAVASSTESAVKIPETVPLPAQSSIEPTSNKAANHNDLTSSVEEYYAELPKIAQPDVRGLERCTRRLNRPKRPRPRTTSTNSRSSSSPPSPPLVQSSSTCCVLVPRTSSAVSPTKLPSLVAHPFPTVASDPILGHPAADLLDKESAVYAEVNDALITGSISRGLFATSDPTEELGSVTQLDPYDTPYTDCYHPCTASMPRRFSFSPVIQSSHPSVCTRNNLHSETTKLENIPLNHPFVSRPLPTIIDSEPNLSVACSSCRNRSSPNSSVCDFELNSNRASPSACNVGTPISEQLETSNFLTANETQLTYQPTSQPCSDYKADSCGHQKSSRPCFSALNNLSSAIRRHGVWFRHSISLRARKQKS